jgi:hypothetical protein
MNALAIIRSLRFPKRFAHLSSDELATLKTKVVGATNNHLSETVYENLSEAAKAENLSNLVGPFGDSIDGELCIRFETPNACRILSA